MYKDRFVVIVENDESDWNDRAGEQYHFPKMYRHILTPGTPVIYYKGYLTKPKYRTRRLADEAHYFGQATIGTISRDPNSAKGDLYAKIVDFQPFLVPVLAKEDGNFLEHVPQKQAKNYWRKGVRKIDQDVFKLIVAKGGLGKTSDRSNWSLSESPAPYESGTEGRSKKMYSTVYERRPELRIAAIQHHGLNCVACDFNFADIYGDYAQGIIHVHHKIPLSQVRSEHDVNPKTDLVPVCPNCHAVIHRRTQYTLSIEELRAMIKARKVNADDLPPPE